MKGEFAVKRARMVGMRVSTREAALLKKACNALRMDISTLARIGLYRVMDEFQQTGTVVLHSAARKGGRR